MRKSKAVVILLIALLVLVPMTMVSGCIETTSLKSDKDVSEAVVDVGGDISNVSETLEELDNSLG